MRPAAPPPPPWTVGRDAERASLRALLAARAPRWVTLAGPPGVGATHLAASLFHELDGPRAWSDARCLPRTLPADGLLVIDGAAPDPALAAALDEALATSPALTLLVTAHGAVGGAAEHVFPLAPLAPPDADASAACAAFALLERHARAADLRVDLRAPAAVAAAAALLRALDGLPGPIVRAASRLRAADPAALAARAARDPDVLAPARASFDAAVDALPPAARDALARLSVCDLPFDLALAEALCGPRALDALDALAARSLVAVERDAAGVVRYRTFAPFRPWALDRSAPASARAAARLLADHCLAAEPGGPRDVHLSRVVSLAAAGDRDDALRARGLLAAARLARRRSLLPDELRALFVDALRRPRGLAAAARARAHLCMARDARVTGRDADARAHLAAAARDARSARDDGLTADVVLEQGVAHHRRRAEAPTRACYERALGLYRALGDATGEGRALGDLGALDHDHGRFELARERYRAALARIRAGGDPWLEGAFLGNLAVLEQELGHAAEAERSFRAALARLEPLGERRLCAITRSNLGSLQHARGDARAAAAQHRLAADALARLGDARSEGLAWARLAASLAALDARADASDALARADAALDRAGDADARAVADLFAALVALLAPPHDVGAARDASAAARRSADGEAPLVERSDDARHAVRLLDEALARAPSPADERAKAELVVEVAARRCRLPNGSVADLARHGAMWRVLLALAEGGADGGGLDVDALVARAWPGERILRDAAANRLYVALSGLRARGLKAWIVRRDDRYAFDPALRVRVAPG